MLIIKTYFLLTKWLHNFCVRWENNDGKKNFQRGFSMRRRLNRWGKTVGKDGESLRNLPRAPPPRPRCSCFSPGGRTTGSVQCWSGGIKRVVTPKVIKDPGWHATPRYPSLPVQTSPRANSLTLQAERAGAEGRWREGMEGGPGDPVWVYDRGMGGWTEERTERLSFNSQFILLDSPQRTIACRMSLQYGHSVSESLTHDYTVVITTLLCYYST